ncbi:MAG: transcriptional regulator, partial [Mesorhizobium sp.]
MSSKAQDDNVFKALAHPRRRALLDELKDAPR